MDPIDKTTRPFENASPDSMMEEIAGDILTSKNTREKQEKPEETPSDKTTPEGQAKPAGEEDETIETVILSAPKPSVETAEQRIAREKKDNKAETSTDNDEGDSFFDYKEPEEVPGDPEKVKPTPEVKYTQEDKDKIDFYNEIASDPLLAHIIESRRVGEDIFSIVEKLKPVDISKKDPIEIIKMECADLGITDQDEIEEEISAYEGLTPAAKKRRITDILSKLKPGNQNNDLLDPAKNPIKKQSEIIQKYNEEVKELTDNLRGKMLYGMKVTDSMADELAADARRFNIQKQDGTINTKFLLQLLYSYKFASKAIRENAKNAKAKGKIETLDELSRADNNETVTTRPPTPNVKRSNEEMVENLAENM